MTVSNEVAPSIETELQQLASRRLGGDRTGAASERRSLLHRLHRRQPLAGAFDSPPGFVFVADAHARPRSS